MEVIEGRHYFITPDGHAYRSLGVNHYHQNIYENRPKGTTPEQIHDEVIRNLHDMGYNAGGYQGPEWMRDRIPYSLGIIEMLLSSYWRPKKPGSPGGDVFTFEDVFDPAYLKRLERTIEEKVMPVKDDPHLICYFFTDVPILTNPNADQNSALLWANEDKTWIDFYEALPSDAPGKIKYEAWRKENPSADRNEFLSLVARQLYSNAHRIIRKHDPNHLIFGTRYHERDMPDYVVKEALPFVDGLTIEMRTRDFDPAFFDEAYAKYGKPIYLGDNIIAARQPIAHGASEHLDYYESHLTAAMAHPQIVGYNRCQYQNNILFMDPSKIKEGLLDKYGKIHDGIMPRLREINLKALQIAYTIPEEHTFFDGVYDEEGEQLMQEASERIEQIRKGDFSLNLIDEQGNPIQSNIELNHRKHEFLFGGAISMAFKEGFGATPATSALAKEVAEDLFNIVSINCHWKETQPAMDRFNWSVPDEILDWAENAGLQARMHALVYMTPVYMPLWKDEVTSTEDWWKQIDIRIAAIADHYGSRIKNFDVINETRYQTQFCEKEAPLFPQYDSPATGARIFEIARKHLPDAALMPLDHFYPVLWSGDKDFQQYLDYCTGLIEEGAPLNAIGYQGHFHLIGNTIRSGNQWGGPDAYLLKAVEKGLDHMAAKLGHPIHITEFGPPSRTHWGGDPANQAGPTDEEIAAWSTNFYTMAFSKPYIKEVTRWFIIDDVGGRGGVDAGLLTNTGQKKPSYYALKKLLQETWSTRFSGTSNNGQVIFRGFFGTYELKVPGYETTTITLLENGQNEQTVRLLKGI